jgi:hypothetical protein
LTANEATILAAVLGVVGSLVGTVLGVVLANWIAQQGAERAEAVAILDARLRQDAEWRRGRLQAVGDRVAEIAITSGALIAWVHDAHARLAAGTLTPLESRSEEAAMRQVYGEQIRVADLALRPPLLQLRDATATKLALRVVAASDLAVEALRESLMTDQPDADLQALDRVGEELFEAQAAFEVRLAELARGEPLADVPHPLALVSKLDTPQGRIKVRPDTGA